jgi:hypothetical protein
MKILSIDPGTTESGWCLYVDGAPYNCGVLPNDDMLAQVAGHETIFRGDGHLAIEMVASYGMAVGKETFRTVWWSGRFAQAWPDHERLVEVYRADVKMHLCGNMKAKDANIRQRIIDLFGGKDHAIGKKAAPGPLYAVKSHAWAALAVAMTAEAKLDPTKRVRAA